MVCRLSFLRWRKSNKCGQRSANASQPSLLQKIPAHAPGRGGDGAGRQTFRRRISIGTRRTPARSADCRTGIASPSLNDQREYLDRHDLLTAAERAALAADDSRRGNGSAAASRSPHQGAKQR